MKTLAGPRVTCFGHALFAAALAGFGVISLVTGHFTYVWQPVPAWVPGRVLLAYASGVLLLGLAAGLLWPRLRAPASLALAFYALASMLLLHIPRAIRQPQTEALWFGVGEIAVIVAGAWILFASATPASATGWRGAVGGERGTRLARLLFGIALVPFGLSHFVYANVTASLVPAWLPGHFGWAYVTGAAHIAAGVAIVLGVVPRLAAMLEAVMLCAFVLTVHVPTVLRVPGSRDEWTELFVACTITGATLLVLHSYRGRPWLAAGRQKGAA